MRARQAGKGWLRVAGACALICALLGAGCAPISFLVAPGTDTPPALPQAPQSAAAVTVAPPAPPSSPSITPSAGPFLLDLTPLPTETALPTLQLPTEALLPATLAVWDGLPTYPADSKPGFDFRLRFDPAVWALTMDQFGSPALANRSLAGCLISPAVGRGLPLNGTVTHDVRRISGISFQINTAYINGVRQFVNYVGGDGTIYTAFQVSFTDQADQCLLQAESIIGTLQAVSVLEATPIATP